MQRIFGDGRAALVQEFHERNVLLRRNETDLVQVGISVGIANEWYASHMGQSDTYWENNPMSWSLVTFSGRFCKNKILFGGKYSSGIWTFGRLDTGAAPAPSTKQCGLAYVGLSVRYGDVLSAASFR